MLNKMNNWKLYCMFQNKGNCRGLILMDTLDSKNRYHFFFHAHYKPGIFFEGILVGSGRDRI